MKTIFSEIINIVNNINSHPLARKHKLVSYFKFIKWQVSQLVLPHEKIISFTNKTFLAVKKGMTGATGNIYLGLHEFNDMAFLLHLLKPEDVFFDIGANIGSYTILASGHCKAKSFSFEPILSTYKTLQKNIILNQLEHLVSAKNIGIGEKECQLTFTCTLDTVNHVVAELEKAEDSIEISVLPADYFLDNNNCPILVKIDVEGFETEVLNGMPLVLQNTMLKAVIIELNGAGLRYGFDETEIHKKLISLNFSPFFYEPFSRSLTLLESYGTNNTIYIRDIYFVEKRIKESEKVKLFSENL